MTATLPCCQYIWRGTLLPSSYFDITATASATCRCPYLWVAPDQRAALPIDTLSAGSAAARVAAGAIVGAAIAVNQCLAVWAALACLADSGCAGPGALAGGLGMAALVLPFAAPDKRVVADGAKLHLELALPGGAEAQVLGIYPCDSGGIAHLHWQSEVIGVKPDQVLGT